MNIINKVLSRRVFLAIQLIFSIIFLYLLINFAAIPNLYLLYIVLGIIGLFFIAFLIQFKAKEKSIRSMIGRLFNIIISIGLVIVCVEINRGLRFIDSFSSAHYDTEAMSVIVLKGQNYQNITDLNKMSIGTNDGEDKTNLTYALGDIREHVKEVKYINYNDWSQLAEALMEGKVDAIVINEAFRGILEERYSDFNNQTRVIYQVKIQSEIENIVNEGAIKEGVFNICITGIDTYGPVSTKSRSDVNMVMTVNMNTHRVLMTGIPRDYYVKLASNGQYDKLTHSGIYGVNETVNTIANLLDVDIDYYFRINFSSLVNIVDVIDGIDIYSDQTFKPLHGSELIVEGMNHMDGAMALAYSRERYAYESGDRHRIQNQQDVIMAIMNKLMTPSVLSNYKQILEKLEGTFETNMSSEDIKAFIRMQIADLKGYEMINQYLDGAGKLTYGLYSMPNGELYTMIPNEETLQQATQKINEIKNESNE